MKSIIFACLLAVAIAGRLESTYLPPNGAHGAGGSGHFLTAPGYIGLSSAQDTVFNGQTNGYSVPITNNYASVAHQYHSAPIPILRYVSQNNGDGSYQFDYSTQNGINQKEAGHLKNVDSSEVHGSYSYTSPEGKQISVNYLADETGFKAAGDHLPTPPPIPEAILRSIQYNAAHAGQSEYSDNEGQYRPNHDVHSQFTQQYVSSKQAGYHY